MFLYIGEDGKIFKGGSGFNFPVEGGAIFQPRGGQGGGGLSILTSRDPPRLLCSRIS